MFSSFAAPQDRSITRSGYKTPRSVIVTTTDRWLRRSVTFTRLPNGRVRWAAVSSYILNRRPLAVRWPCNTEPYQLAMPLLIRVMTVVLGAGTVVTISDDRTSLATIVESVARSDAGLAVSAKADRITSAATVTAVLDLPAGVAVRSVPGLVSIP